MDIFTISGYIFSAAGFGFGIYNYHERRQAEEREELLENRLREKEKHQELSAELYELRKGIGHLCEPLCNPTTHEDLRFSLRDLGRDVLAYYHTTGEPATIQLHEITTHGEEGEKFINNPKKALSAHKNSQLVTASHRIRNDSKEFVSQEFVDSRTYNVLHPFPTTISLLYNDIEEIKKTHADFTEHFEMIDEIIKLLDELTIDVYERIFQVKDGMPFDPSEYDTTASLTNDIYDTFISTDKIQSKIMKLEQIIDEINGFQKSLFTS